MKEFSKEVYLKWYEEMTMWRRFEDKCRSLYLKQKIRGFLHLYNGQEAIPAGFAPIAIGLALTLIHLISIPVTNTSVNPARSTAVAIFAETAALGQLWLFWVAPIVGAIIGAVIYKVVGNESQN